MSKTAINLKKSKECWKSMALRYNCFFQYSQSYAIGFMIITNANTTKSKENWFVNLFGIAQATVPASQQLNIRSTSIFWRHKLTQEALTYTCCDACQI